MEYEISDKLQYHLLVFKRQMDSKFVAMIIEMDSLFAISNTIEDAKADVIKEGHLFLDNNPEPDRIRLPEILALVHENGQQNNIVSIGKYQF